MAVRKKRRKSPAFFVLLVVVIVAVLLLLLIPFARRYRPSHDPADYTSYYGLDTDEAMFVVVNNERSQTNGLYIDGHAYVDYDTVHDMIDSRYFWDSKEQVLRYALPDKLISVDGNSSTYSEGNKKEEKDYTICRIEGDTMYLSMDFVSEYSDLRYKYYDDPSRLVVSTEWGDLSYTEMKRATEVREKGGIKSPVLTKTKKGDLVTVVEEGSKWDKICTEDGFIGYVRSRTLGKTQTVKTESTKQPLEYTKITRDYPINLGWHQVTNMTANKNVGDVIKSVKGMNVISPTWFYVNDNEGGIKSLASRDYVSYCHDKGLEVWGLVNNLENPDVDITSVLNTTSSRDYLVNQLIAEAIQYDLDGINVDFESLRAEAGDGFIEFIRELSLKCANNDIVLSVDNYVPSAYTSMYHRDEQALFADYIILMAYDEHYQGSEEGSVASIGFVKKGVEDTLKQVPKDQLILGIPFYTRIWAETPSKEAESGYTLSSEAVGMAEVESRLNANDVDRTWLDDCGQYYAEYQKDGKTYKMWIEDQNSIEEKLKVYKENDLAGVAFWKLGMEQNSIWDTVAKYVK